MRFRDSLKLPFAISDKKKISNEDYQHKREGTYATGLPNFEYDPVNGLGYGVNGFLIFNGKRSDALFGYTPYKAKLELDVFNTTKNERSLNVKLDMPYFLRSQWRLRANLTYESNPNPLYFGMGTPSLQGLSYYPDGDSSQAPVTDAIYDDYDASLGDANENYNTFAFTEEAGDINLERNFFDGRVRVLLGYELGHVNVAPFEGNSLMKKDYQAGKVFGVGSFITSILQTGIAYDTRDLEPDPSRGVFAEVFNEFSHNAIGAQFNFDKLFAHVNCYAKLFPGVFKKLVFASRVGVGGTGGNAPFYEYRDQPSSEGDIEALGGPSSLRGYKEDRFVGVTTAFANVELRYRFARFRFLKQDLALSAVPFADAGGIWDRFSDILKQNNLRYSAGGGLRIAWNVSTIIRLDYAFSKEDRQFFLELHQAF